MDTPRDLGDRVDLDRIEQARQQVLAASNQQDEHTRILFHTWFLSGLGFHRCTASRPVWLGADKSDRPSEIQQVWGHRLDPHWPYRLILVDPPVEPPEDGVHILVIQQEHEQERGALLSNFWHAYRTQIMMREAHLLPSWLFFDHLLAFLGLRDACVQLKFIFVLVLSVQHPSMTDCLYIPSCRISHRNPHSGMGTD